MFDKVNNTEESSDTRLSNIEISEAVLPDNHENLSTYSLKKIDTSAPIAIPYIIPQKRRNLKSNSDPSNQLNPMNKRNAASFPIYYSSRFDNSPPIFGDHNKYDPILNAKGAGIIPYSIVNGNIYFLLQHADVPCRKKEHGWNDFGGKRNGITLKDNPFVESTLETATREFSEETSCLFYFQETEQNDLYERIKTGDISLETMEDITRMIPLSQAYFVNKIQAYDQKIFLSAKETYITYFLRVNYIPSSDIPKSEDLHIPYIERYTRVCKWFSYQELMKLNPQNFHKRLQITKNKQSIKYFYERRMFT